MSQNVIERLRQKPKEAKNRIALMGAGSITAAVFMAWIVTSTGDFNNVVQGSKQGAGAFSTFIDQLKEETSAVYEALPQEAASTTELQAHVNAQLSGSSTAGSNAAVQPRIAYIATTTATTSEQSTN